MSKKKGKPVAKKAPKKKAAKKPVAKSRASVGLAAGAPSKRTKTATIFIFQTGSGTKIRTSPQRVYANRGDHLEFNIVNMIDDSDVEVTIEFPGGGPWGTAPFKVRNWDRKPFGDSPLGRFKYVVSALGAQEDPEVELPEGN